MQPIICLECNLWHDKSCRIRSKVKQGHAPFPGSISSELEQSLRISQAMCVHCKADLWKEESEMQQAHLWSNGATLGMLNTVCIPQALYVERPSGTPDNECVISNMKCEVEDYMEDLAHRRTSLTVLLG
jgi:hypothetical protein